MDNNNCQVKKRRLWTVFLMTILFVQRYCFLPEFQNNFVGFYFPHAGQMPFTR